MTSKPRREWKSFTWVLKCSVSPLMRSVRSATCTSGEPVSLPERWYCLTTCVFCATCRAIRLFSLSFEPAILTFFSHLREPEGSQSSLLGTPDSDQGAVGTVDRGDALCACLQRQRLAVAQLRRQGRVEVDPGQIGEQRVEADETSATLGRRHRFQRRDRNRVIDPEPARAGAAKASKVRAASQHGADILGERADVSAFAATDADIQQWFFEIKQFELQDPHAARSALDALPAAGKPVQRHAIPL